MAETNAAALFQLNPCASLNRPCFELIFQPTGIIFELFQDIIRMNLLTKFHEDQTINVASRMKNAPPLGSHVFQANVTIFQLIQDIIETNLLTKFYEDWTINVASRELHGTRQMCHIWKNAPPPGGHVFQPNSIIFELVQDINGVNLLTKFHKDWTINVASREKFPAPGGHVFAATKTIFILIQDIIGTILLTKFHDDRKINVTSRTHPRGGNVFQPTGIIFELVQDIIGMNLLTKFHEDRIKNMASRVHIWKNAPPLGGHVFQANVTIFELIQDIIKTNLLTIFHQDWTINVASREKCPTPGGHFHEDWTINVASRVKNAQPLAAMFFKQCGTILLSKVLTRFYYNSHIRKNAPPHNIIGINLLTKFHVDWTINVASSIHIGKKAPPLGSHVFQAKVTIFELIQDNSGTNLLSKFHKDRKINVASRVLTRKNAPPPGGHFYEDKTITVASRVHIRKNALPLGSHIFQANVTIFNLIQNIIETNLLTKFHEDLTINEALES
ncbi:hypothetical protein DPMN_069586 [Dreissena polymorpha]|uniref:Uncharacterized protein n=1 Tax=Dreissena polymorpha TaxID=45954 RepID=A0A9D4BV22_DREPO|nr:hypothetical protein DPMN_069586 [Dreissena polymorpha]